MNSFFETFFGVGVSYTLMVFFQFYIVVLYFICAVLWFYATKNYQSASQ